METGFSRILVGIDGSEESMNAAEYGVSIAKLYNAELIAINVLTSDIGYVYSSPGMPSHDYKGDHIDSRRRSKIMV